MSKLVANSIQLGQSATPSQNFTLSVPSPQDGTLKLSRNTSPTATDILTVNGSGVVSFINPPINAGKILQEVSTQVTSVVSVSITTAGTFYDAAGLSATITPTSASNKILILGKITMGQASSGYPHHCRLVRGSTPIAIGDAAGSRVQTTITVVSYSGSSTPESYSLVWTDSPSSTSPVTYKLQSTSSLSGVTAYFNRAYSEPDSIDYGRSVTQITLLEISA